MKQIVPVNLVAVFVIAFACTTFFHELAHALTALAAGIAPVLYHTYVSYNDAGVPPAQQALVAASGPLFSLLQAVCFLWALKRRKKNDLVAWLFFWLAEIGMIVFFGYILMGPFVPYGDTGKVYRLLAVPSFLPLTLAVLAVFVLRSFFKRMVAPARVLLVATHHATGSTTSQPLNRYYALPVCAGTVLNTLLSLPAPTVMSLAFPLILPLVLLPTWLRLRKEGLPDLPAKNDVSPDRTMARWPVIAIILLLILSRLLAAGLQL